MRPSLSFRVASAPLLNKRSIIDCRRHGGRGGGGGAYVGTAKVVLRLPTPVAGVCCVVCRSGTSRVVACVGVVWVRIILRLRVFWEGGLGDLSRILCLYLA